MDILTGLIKPVTGKILIDKKELHTETWQNICGYVSQNLFFFNDTLAKNIAFGESKQILILRKLMNVLKLLNLKNLLKKMY